MEAVAYGIDTLKVRVPHGAFHVTLLLAEEDYLSEEIVIPMVTYGGLLWRGSDPLPRHTDPLPTPVAEVCVSFLGGSFFYLLI